MSKAAAPLHGGAAGEAPELVAGYDVDGMTDGIDPKAERSIRSSQTIRIVAVLVVITVLAVWAIANTDDVQVDWIADTTTAPLIVVIGASAVLGFIIGLLVNWRHRS